MREIVKSYNISALSITTELHQSSKIICDITIEIAFIFFIVLYVQDCCLLCLSEQPIVVRLGCNDVECIELQNQNIMN